MKFVDFCSGIGGGRVALELLGFECVGFSEIDKNAIKTYKSFFDVSKEIEFGDLTKINLSNLPNFDLLIAGFPCQSFSIVGKRAGLKSTNGQIIYQLAKILKAKKPKFFILENVKGILSLDGGMALSEILNLLINCGYKVEFSLLNTLNFGLAQSRERVYFVGIRDDLQMNFDFLELKFLNIQSNLSDFLSPKKEYIFDESIPSYQTFLRYLNNKYNKDKFNINELLEQNYLVIDTRQSDLRLYINKIPTIRRDRQGILYVYNKKLYKLSGLEALKLQGFGVISDLNLKISNLTDQNLLKQSGNAMSVNVIKNIAQRLKEY